ncbi:MAG TPA: DUF4333 domain-containing protein [Actinomycetota bacterium]|nr:DUF4333 domain-containing protein [Actinomycetota bacterium]
MSSGSPPSRTLALLLFLSMAATGCAPQTLDVDQLERRLERQISNRLGVERVVAECPDDVEAREGARFDCTVRARGETAGLRIVVTQVDGDGTVTWEIAGAGG